MATAYRVPVMEKFAWQDPIVNILSAQPADPNKNDRYIVGPTATGLAWEGQEKKIAWYDGEAWKFDVPAEGWRIFNKGNNTFYSYFTGAWSNATIVGDLTITGTGITSTANEIDWELKDNQANALEFKTATNVPVLNFDTRDGVEEITVGVDFAVLGEDIDLSSSAKSIAINPGALAISFDTTSAIFSINATNGAEVITAHKNMTVLGDLSVMGTTTTINSEELTVSDRLITLNSNGTDASMIGAGIEIDGTGGSPKAYAKLGVADTTVWEFKASNDNVLTLDINASETLTIAGSLDVEADSAINQDVTTDALPTFAGLTLNGNVTIAADDATAFAVTDGTTNLLAFDTTTLAKKVTINSDLGVNGDIILESGGTIVDTAAALTLTDHNSISVTVAQAFQAYDDRAQYDSTLGCIVFPGLDII